MQSHEHIEAIHGKHMLQSNRRIPYYQARVPAGSSKSTRRRCKICNAPTSFHCVLCSKDLMDKDEPDLVCICPSSKGKNCLAEHIAQAEKLLDIHHK